MARIENYVIQTWERTSIKEKQRNVDVVSIAQDYIAQELLGLVKFDIIKISKTH